VTDIAALLSRVRTVAVVGCSTNPAKAAYSVPAAVQASGYRIIPVNPHADEILGERAYPVLADVPEPIDLVDVFRPPAEAAGVAEQAVAVGARALWLQTGIRSDEARRIATDAGLDYVEDACLGVAARQVARAG
jgi:uncharacterized protein